MAEFGPSVTEAPQTPSFTTPKEGVVDEPTAIKGLTNIFRGVRETKNESYLNKFTEQQLSIIEAIDNGDISSDAGRSRMRKNIIQAVHDYPSLRKDIIQTNASLIGAGGMGGVVTRGTREEMRQEALRDNLVSNGLVRADASEEEFNQAEENFVMAQEAARRFDSRMQTIRIEKARADLSASRRSALDQMQKDEAEKFLVDTAPAYMDQFKSTAENLLKLVGTEGYDEGTVVRLIEERFNNFEEELAQPLSMVDSHTADALMKNYRDYKNIVIARAKGEFSQSAYDREIERITTTQTLVAMKNPVIAKAVALSKLGLNDLLLPEKLQVSEAAAEFLATNLDDEKAPANLFTDSAVGRDALKHYFKTVGQNPDSLDEEQKLEQAKHLQKIFTSVEDYESFVSRNPEKAIGLVTDWMSTQEFYNLRTKYSDQFTNTDTAMRILQANYGDEVWGMVSREFRNNDVRISVAPGEGEAFDPISGPTKDVDTNQLVGYRSTSNGMEFYALTDQDEAKQKAKRLNKNLAPIINKNIKAFAHLEGSNNYKQYWEQIDEQYMSGGEAQGGGGGGDTGDDLEISDFQERLEEVERTSDPAGSVVDAGAGYTVVEMEDGTVERRTGTRAWRNNNPGNIEYGKFAKAHGAIGTDGRFAVFKTYEDGRAAKEALLFETSSYKNKTIAQAIARYAPAFENDTNSYARNIANAAGVSVNTKLSDLTASQRSAMLDAMERVEGFKVGKTQVVS